MDIDNKLIEAACNGNIEEVKKYLDKGANIHAGNDLALRWASSNGHTETVKLLLDRGANIRACNDYALRYASRNGHTETVKLLLDRGADIHADDDLAFHWASSNGHTETVKVLEEHIKLLELRNEPITIKEENWEIEITERFNLETIDCDEEIKELRKILKIKK